MLISGSHFFYIHFVALKYAVIISNNWWVEFLWLAKSTRIASCRVPNFLYCVHGKCWSAVATAESQWEIVVVEVAYNNSCEPKHFNSHSPSTLVRSSSSTTCQKGDKVSVGKWVNEVCDAKVKATEEWRRATGGSFGGWNTTPQHQKATKLQLQRFHATVAAGGNLWLCPRKV